MDKDEVDRLLTGIIVSPEATEPAVPTGPIGDLMRYAWFILPITSPRD